MTKHCKGTQKWTAVALLALGATVLAAGPASAHHVMGGKLPANFLQGFLSGLGHPVIGIDHFAFIVAVGVASAFLTTRYALPAIFVAATVVGCLLRGVAGLQLPLIEVAVAGSLLVLGGLVMSGAAMHERAYGVLFAAAGLFHGAAYAASIIGVEPTPLLAYLAGFSVVQYAVVLGTIWLVRQVWQATSSLAVAPRLTGALVAGMGAAFLVENIEAIVFPGL